MLLNECFYRDDEQGGKTRWFYPSEVEVALRRRRAPGRRARASADGLPVMLGGIEKMSK